MIAPPGTAMWVDSHCHLDFPDFAEEGVATLIDRARLNRVGHLLTISTHTQRLARYTDIADRFANVWTTIGVHPHQADEAAERDVTADALVMMAAHPKIVALGECGLDYHYHLAPRDVQHRVFRAHIEAAKISGLPLVVHAREADDDMIALLQEAGEGGDNRLKGVLHCFSSTPQLAEFALSIGFYISFSGIVTFPKSDGLQEICRTIPRDRILVETDAPYLAPAPYRGRRNEPAFVSHTGRFIADLHGVDEAALAAQTTANFFNLFTKTAMTREISHD